MSELQGKGNRLQRHWDDWAQGPMGPGVKGKDSGDHLPRTIFDPAEEDQVHRGRSNRWRNFGGGYMNYKYLATSASSNRGGNQGHYMITDIGVRGRDDSDLIPAPFETVAESRKGGGITVGPSALPRDHPGIPVWTSAWWLDQLYFEDGAMRKQRKVRYWAAETEPEELKTLRREKHKHNKMDTVPE